MIFQFSVINKNLLTLIYVTADTDKRYFFTIIPFIVPIKYVTHLKAAGYFHEKSKVVSKNYRANYLSCIDQYILKKLNARRKNEAIAWQDKKKRHMWWSSKRGL